MENLEFVDLFQKNNTHKISSNFPLKQKVIKADSIKTKIFKESENQSHIENKPEIKLKKRGDLVDLIIVTCSCGKEIQIALEYDNNRNKADDVIKSE